MSLLGGFVISQLLLFASFDTVLNLDNAVLYYNTIERKTWFLGYIYSRPHLICLVIVAFLPSLHGFLIFCPLNIGQSKKYYTYLFCFFPPPYYLDVIYTAGVHAN